MSWDNLGIIYMKISMAIPVYEMSGKGIDCLSYCLESIREQTYQPYEIIVSDHSKNNDIFNFCKLHDMTIKYIRNKEKRGSLGSNLNSCIIHASGDIIKFIMQDDFLLTKDSLLKTKENFNLNKNWMVTSYFHTKDRINFFNMHIPIVNTNIILSNTIGTPSCLTIKNENVIYFDENLQWYVDSEYYFRLYNKFGLPIICNIPLVCQFLWEGQTTNAIITDEIVSKEKEYLYKKYENRK